MFNIISNIYFQLKYNSSKFMILDTIFFHLVNIIFNSTDNHCNFINIPIYCKYK